MSVTFGFGMGLIGGQVGLCSNCWWFLGPLAWVATAVGELVDGARHVGDWEMDGIMLHAAPAPVG